MIASKNGFDESKCVAAAKMDLEALEIARIEQHMQRTVDAMQLQNFIIARRKQRKIIDSTTMKQSKHTLSDNVIARTRNPCIVTASGVQSFDGLDDSNTYISSDEEEEEHLLEEQEVECHLEELKPTFMTAPKGLYSSGISSSNHKRSIYLPGQGRRPYYDMDDDEYVQAYCSGRNNIHSQFQGTVAQVQTHLTYNHQMNMGEMGLKLTPLTQQLKVSHHKEESSSRDQRHINSLALHSSVTTMATASTTICNSTMNPQILNNQSACRRDKVQNNTKMDTRDTKEEHVINRQQKKSITTKLSTVSSSKINDSFDSTSSLEMSRISTHEKDHNNRSIHHDKSYSVLDYSEDTISTPAISNKTRSRMSDVKKMPCINNNYSHDANEKRQNAVCEEFNNNNKYNNRHQSSTNISSSSSSSLGRFYDNNMQLTYQPPCGIFGMSSTPSISTLNQHDEDDLQRDELMLYNGNDSKISSSSLSTTTAKISTTRNTCLANINYKKEMKTLQIPCKEKLLDERHDFGERFQSSILSMYKNDNYYDDDVDYDRVSSSPYLYYSDSSYIGKLKYNIKSTRRYNNHMTANNNKSSNNSSNNSNNCKKEKNIISTKKNEDDLFPFDEME